MAIAASVAELVVASDVLLSSLANDEAVYSVYLSEGGVFSAAKRGTIILEMSTISPELSRLLHRQACTLGLNFLDLAVSGSTPAVEAGTITLLPTLVSLRPTSLVITAAAAFWSPLSRREAPPRSAWSTEFAGCFRTSSKPFRRNCAFNRSPINPYSFAQPLMGWFVKRPLLPA